MKGLALESVVKWIILIVAAGVIINLVFFFYDDIKRFVENWINPTSEFETEIVEADVFSTAQVMTYIRACWDRTGERFKKDVICYILKGDVSGVDVNMLNAAVEAPAQVDTTGFNPTEKTTIIRFEDVGNKIIVES